MSKLYYHHHIFTDGHYSCLTVHWLHPNQKTFSDSRPT